MYLPVVVHGYHQDFKEKEKNSLYLTPSYEQNIALPLQQTRDVLIIEPSSTVVAPSGTLRGFMMKKKAIMKPQIGKVQIRGIMSMSLDSCILEGH